MARNPREVGPGHGTNRAVEVLADGSLTITHAAAVLGVTSQTVRNWIDAGAPCIPGGQGRGNVARIRISDLIGWRVDQELAAAGVGEGNEYDEARARAMDWHFRAVQRQAAAHRDLGTLIPVDLIADVIEQDYQDVRSSLNSIPGRISIKVAAESSVAVVRRIISKAIAEALSNLSAPSKLIEEAGGDPDGSVHDPVELDPVPGDADPVDDDGEGAEEADHV